MPKFVIKISAPGAENLLSDDNVGCFIIDSSLPKSYIDSFISQATANEKIVLLSGKSAAVLCNAVEADGIVADLSSSDAIKKDMAFLRSQIGSRFLGVICRNRRHEAMVVSENDPDFVIFKIWHDGVENTLELAKWYTEFFLIQMAVQPEDEEVDFNVFPGDMVILSPESYKILVAKK